MVSKAKNYHFFFLIAVSVCIIIFSGCVSPLQQLVENCPGAGSAVELISILKQNAQTPNSFRANGRCRLQYYDTNGVAKKESFNVKVWCNKPSEVYLQGDIAFDPKGIIVGSNEHEFWLVFRPKEVNSFYWGRWSETEALEEFIISPKILLRGLGIIEIENENEWSLSKQRGFDVLTKDGGKGESQKLYISNCDYTVKRIEYLDDNSQVGLAVELSNYKKMPAGGMVAFGLNIIKTDGDGKEESATITFSSIKEFDFTEKQKERLFTRPESQGFEHVYKFIDSEFVEQMY